MCLVNNVINNFEKQNYNTTKEFVDYREQNVVNFRQNYNKIYCYNMK